MAKAVKFAKLDSRAARDKLKVNPKPYYYKIDEGIHIGYRKSKSGGKWVVRLYRGDQDYITETIATADDSSDADGLAILSWKQACDAARKRASELAHAEAGVHRGKYTVTDCMADYLKLISKKTGTADLKNRIDVWILPPLGSIECSKLTAKKIRDWHESIATSPARVRGKPGAQPKFRPVTGDDHARRRKSTANRILTVLKAALNHAWREKKITSDAEWRLVEPYESVDSARIRFLSIDEAKRLVNACPADFRQLVQLALLTGARYSEITAFKVYDFNADSGTLHVRQSKSGKARHIVLTDEGVNFVRRLIMGKNSSDRILLRADGKPWERSHQFRPIRQACIAAGIEPTNFHALRHTYASLSVMNNMPLMVLARNLGHSTTRMVEKHYGHLTDNYLASTIRSTAPTFGIEVDNVTPLKLVKS